MTTLFRSCWYAHHQAHVDFASEMGHKDLPSVCQNWKYFIQQQNYVFHSLRNKLGKNFFHLITQSKNLCLNDIMFTLFSKWMLLSSYLKDIQWALISYYPLPLYPSACNFGKSIKPYIKPYNATNISLLIRLLSLISRTEKLLYFPPVYLDVWKNGEPTNSLQQPLIHHFSQKK